MTIAILTLIVVIAAVMSVAIVVHAARDLDRKELKRSAQREANGSNSTSMYRHINRK